MFVGILFFSFVVNSMGAALASSSATAMVTSIDEVQRVFATAQPQQPPPAASAAKGAPRK